MSLRSLSVWESCLLEVAKEEKKASQRLIKRPKSLLEEANYLFYLGVNAHCALLNPKSLYIKKFLRSARRLRPHGQGSHGVSSNNTLRGVVEGRTLFFLF